MRKTGFATVAILATLLLCLGGNVWAQAPATPAPAADPNVFEIIPINNTVVGEVMTLMAKHPLIGIMTPDPVSNKISLCGPKSAVDAVKADIAKIDYPRRKAEITVSAIESLNSVNQNIGIDWSREKLTPQQSGNGVWKVAFTGGYLGWSSTNPEAEKTIFNLIYLQSRNQTKTLTTPRFIVTDGSEAQVFLGQKIWVKVYSTINNAPVQPQAIEAGVSMDVTARITDDNQIVIKANKIEVSETVGSGPDGLPITSTRNFSATQKVKDGESMIFAGLISSYEGRSHTKVPILGEIPLIGQLFRSSGKVKTERELTILVTAQIVQEKGSSTSVEKAKEVEKERVPTTTPGIEPSTAKDGTENKPGSDGKMNPDAKPDTTTAPDEAIPVAK